MKYLRIKPLKVESIFNKGSIGMVLCIIAALIFLLLPTASIRAVVTVTQFAVHHFGLSFIIISSSLFILSIVIALSPVGRIRLGGDTVQPEFGMVSWLAMLFAAGMGSGLIFWGVAEPVFHFSNLPAFAAHTDSPKNMALALTYFHWGVHAWSIYAMAGLVMAWFAFNRSRSMSISASFTQTEHQKGKYYVLDYIAVVAVIFGVAGTLANTIALVQSGMEDSLHWGIGGVSFRLSLLFIIALFFTVSSSMGLNKGIKWLSLFNLYFVIVLLAVVIWLVNPWTVFERVLGSTLVYIKQLPFLSFTIDKDSRQWSENWSIIYILWWIAWAPFVGPFIARISIGRTIRQFLLCVIFIPTLTTILWFSAFAGGVFGLPIFDQVVTAVNQDYTQGLFAFFSYFPLSSVLSIAAILLLITFVVTSADSAIYVTSLLTGDEGLLSKLSWSAILIAISIALVIKNDVDLNKQIAIVGAIPFTLVLVFQVIMLVKDLVAYQFSNSARR